MASSQSARNRDPFRRQIAFTSFVAIALLAVAAACAVRDEPPPAPAEPIVETSYGTIRGALADGIYAFKGVPYGGTTAGANRFKPPTKPAPWEGVRDAIEYGNRSPQPHAEAVWFGEIRKPLVRRAITIMDRFISKELSVTDIARRLQVSNNTLYRAFEQTVGESPARFFRIAVGQIVSIQYQSSAECRPLPHMPFHIQRRQLRLTFDERYGDGQRLAGWNEIRILDVLGFLQANDAVRVVFAQSQ